MTKAQRRNQFILETLPQLARSWATKRADRHATASTEAREALVDAFEAAFQAGVGAALDAEDGKVRS